MWSQKQRRLYPPHQCPSRASNGRNMQKSKYVYKRF
jgi:hypothetical protein